MDIVILMETMELMTIMEIIYISISVLVVTASIVNIADPLFLLNIVLFGILKRVLKWQNTTKRELESLETKKEKNRGKCVKDVENAIVRLRNNKSPEDFDNI